MGGTSRKEHHIIKCLGLVQRGREMQDVTA